MFPFHYCIDRRKEKVGAVSFSEIEAQTVIADKEERKDSSSEIQELFFDPKKLQIRTIVGKCFKPFPSFVLKVPGRNHGCITTKDASNF